MDTGVGVGLACSRARGERSPRAALDTWMRAMESAQRNDSGPWTTLLLAVREVARHHGDRPALIGEDTQLTYRELVSRSDAYTKWALGEGLGIGDVVTLLMPNCPDYVAIWFGIAQTGCTVALVNTSLAGDALAHAIRVACPSRIIVASCLLDALEPVVARLPVGISISVHGGDRRDLARIDDEILALIDATSEPGATAPERHHRALLIGTSGTTGLPKAANITHARVLDWSFWFAGLMDTRPEDRVYDCLPMYHSVGGIVAVGAALVRGACVVIRRRFSAGRFWDDIIENRCTIFQYIGELCRYLNNSGTEAQAARHQLRLCCGNGLRREVWETFRRRFNIPEILEFYAATEGNVSLYNCEARPGAVGRIPTFLRHRFPIELIRLHPDTGEPVRDANGLCVRCVPGEAGEAIGHIESGSSAPRRFDGYTDPQASARKVLVDVFANGERWFRTGDLMRRDQAGFFFFVDRIGDTFRWKGENVSTSEVAEVIGACVSVADVLVSGVAIPGHDGRAGIAAITRRAGFSFECLTRHLAEHLPHYARPCFVHLRDTLDLTETFKFVRSSPTWDALEIAAESGELWFFDGRFGAYVICDGHLLREIYGARIRV